MKQEKLLLVHWLAVTPCQWILSILEVFMGYLAPY